MNDILHSIYKDFNKEPDTASNTTQLYTKTFSERTVITKGVGNSNYIDKWYKYTGKFEADAGKPTSDTKRRRDQASINRNRN